MEERNKITSIFKSKSPEKLVVFHTASLQNEIRFYLNDMQYITAVECEEGCLIRLEEEREENDDDDKKNTISIIKKNVKKFIRQFSISLGFIILVFIGWLYLIKRIDSILVYLIIINIIAFVIDIVIVIILEIKGTTPAIKSKRSAEHMIVNFLEINKRLPKNIEEVKKSSRFSKECGSRKLIQAIAEDLIISIVATILTAIVSIIVSHFSSNSVTNVIWCTYFITNFVVEIAIIKYDALNFIIKPIKKVLTNIAQYANTTSKVKDKDIILAYSVAKTWLQVVYPEFYNENEDIFWKQYLKVNN